MALVVVISIPCVAGSTPISNSSNAVSWGRNFEGELGDGTTMNRTTPVGVIGLPAMSQISSGGWHSLGLAVDGTAWAWGDNGFGQLGDGTTTNRPTPVQVIGISNVAQVSGGPGISLALTRDGLVWEWGGLVGLWAEHSVPIPKPGLTEVIAIDAGGGHNLALKSDGTVWAWGSNGVGQLGIGITTPTPLPFPVTDDEPLALPVSGLKDVIAISAGAGYSLALKANGTIWAWGYNGDGRLGDGTEVNRNVPVQVHGLTGIVAVAAGFGNSAAITGDGSVWVWGDTLSTAEERASVVPVLVQDIPPMTTVSAGFWLFTTVDRSGCGWSWGFATFGGLGNGTDGDTISEPVQVSAPCRLKSVSTGVQYSLALTSS